VLLSVFIKILRRPYDSQPLQKRLGYVHDTCVKEVTVVSSIWECRRVTCGVESRRADINLCIIIIIIIIIIY
jgi:hypothetical protein